MPHNQNSTSGGYVPIFKFLAVGDKNTGKTSTIKCLESDDFRFQHNETPTNVIDFYLYSRKNQPYRYQLWDSAGDVQQKGLVMSYYTDQYIFIGFFDVTRADASLKTLLERAKDVQEKANEGKSKKIPLILVGAKADNDLVIDASVSELAQNAKAQLEELGFELITGDKPYIPVSAQDNKGIHDDLLEALHKAAKMKLGIQFQALPIIQSHLEGDKAVDNQSQNFLDNHPNVKMALAVTGLVLGIAAIATVTVLTCGVAGVLGAAAAAIAATLTLHASLTMVSIVAGGVGLFATSSIAKCAHVIHNTKSKPPTL